MKNKELQYLTSFCASFQTNNITMAGIKRKERDWEIENQYVSEGDSDEDLEQHPRIRDILIELSKKIPLNKASDFLHTLASAKEILYWTPKGELLFHGRRIPVTNITELADYVLLPYNEDVEKPRGLSTFMKGLAEVGINKSLIRNKKLVMEIIDLEKEANFVDESSESGQESESGGESESLDESEYSGEQEDTSENDSQTESQSEGEDEEVEEPWEVSCPNCENQNRSRILIQSCPHCGWQEAIKVKHFAGKVLSCEMCKHNFSKSWSTIPEGYFRCKDCGHVKFQRAKSGRSQDFYPSETED